MNHHKIYHHRLPDKLLHELSYELSHEAAVSDLQELDFLPIVCIYSTTNDDSSVVMCYHSDITTTLQIGIMLKQDGMLSQGGPRDAAVNFDTYRILQRHRAVSLPQHGSLVGLCLQTAVNYLSKSDKY